MFLGNQQQVLEQALAELGLSLDDLKHDVYGSSPGASDWLVRALQLGSNRQDFIRRYSYAVPTREALQAIARYSPLVEVGAGTGYWAMLLQDAGADVVALDTHPPHPGNKNTFVKPFAYTEVLFGGPGSLKRYPDRTLFLCWPPYNTPMAMACLKVYRGQQLVYIGEGEWGCTGDKAFHRALAREWEVLERIELPQWPGIHDGLRIYRRKGICDKVPCTETEERPPGEEAVL